VGRASRRGGGPLPGDPLFDLACRSQETVLEENALAFPKEDALLLVRTSLGVFFFPLVLLYFFLLAFVRISVFCRSCFHLRPQAAKAFVLLFRLRDFFLGAR